MVEFMHFLYIDKIHSLYFDKRDPTHFLTSIYAYKASRFFRPYGLGVFAYIHIYIMKWIPSIVVLTTQWSMDGDRNT